MQIKTFLLSMPIPDRESFAQRCKTTAGHLRNCMYGYKKISASLAIEIERESAGTVTVEEMRPDVDWSVIRGSRVGGCVIQVEDAA